MVCAFPPPVLEGANAVAMSLFAAAFSYGTADFKGMDGYPMGMRPMEIEAAARGMDIPWCYEIEWRFRVIHDIWLARQRALFDAAVDAAKRKGARG